MATHRLAPLFLALAFAACDLRHCEQRRFCASANSNQDLCESRPDWCNPYGRSSCVAKVAGANCTPCQISAFREGAPCTNPTGDAAFCSTQCKVHIADFQCLAQNLCSDVICP